MVNWRDKLLVEIRAFKKMDFTKAMQYHLKVFHVLGLSPNLSNSDQYHKLCFADIVGVTQAIFALSLSISCLIILVFGEHTYLTKVDVTVIGFLAIADGARSSCSAIHCIFYKHLFFEISQRIGMLQACYDHDLNRKVSFVRFTKKYNRKVAISVCGYLLYCIAFIYIALKTLYAAGIQVIILRLFMCATFMHTILYVDVLCYYLDEFVAVIEEDVAIHSNSVLATAPKLFLVRKKLKRYKSVHFQLLQITQRVNDFFGWTSVTIFLQAFLNVVNASYWMIQQIILRCNFVAIIGNSLK